MPHPVDRKKVSRWVRVLAVGYVLCLAFMAWSVLLRLAGGLPVSLGAPSMGFLGTVLFAYCSFLFGYVAVTGRHPLRFFPLAAVSFPLFGFPNRPSLRAFGLRFRNRSR